MIGTYQCTVSSSTGIEVICAAGQNPIGTYSLIASVVNKGLAQMSSSFSISFTLTASSISPTKSGTGGYINEFIQLFYQIITLTLKGGLLLNITGFGFGPNCTVTVDGSNCAIHSISYSLISCIVPPNVTFKIKY